jgi:hypothetical protein
MKNCTDYLIIAQVLKKIVFKVSALSVWNFCLVKRTCLIIIVAHISYHTPVKTLYGLTWETCSFNSSHTHCDETSLCCWTEWVCSLFFQYVPMKVAVHKVQSCFTDFVNHSCLYIVLDIFHQSVKVYRCRLWMRSWKIHALLVSIIWTQPISSWVEDRLLATVTIQNSISYSPPFILTVPNWLNI